MKRWLLRMGLATGLGWGLVAAGAFAQEPGTLIPVVSPAAPNNLVQPVVHDYRNYQPTAPVAAPGAVPVAAPDAVPLAAPGCSAQPPLSVGDRWKLVQQDCRNNVTKVPVLAPTPDPQPPRPTLDWWRQRGYHCWSDMKTSGCTSFSSEWRFVFGSCRQFFGQPCLTGPPEQPGAAGGGGGCNCRP